MAARVVRLAEFVEVAHRNRRHATPRSRSPTRRSASSSIPTSSRSSRRCREGLPRHRRARARGTRSWTANLPCAPSPKRELDAALAAIGRFVDLKSPYFLGHSRSGRLPRAPTPPPASTCPPPNVRPLHRAGLASGSAASACPTPSGTSAGPLTAAEWERVRLVPQLARADAPSVSIAGADRLASSVQFRERLDGSGYPSGIGGDAHLPPSSRSSAPPTAIRRCSNPAHIATAAHRR